METAEELGEVGMNEETVAAIEVGAGGEKVDGGDEEVDGGEGGGEVDGGVDHGKEGQQEVGCQEVSVIPKLDQGTVIEVNKQLNKYIFFL